MDFNLYLWKLGPFSKISIAQLRGGKILQCIAIWKYEMHGRGRLIARVFSGY